MRRGRERLDSKGCGGLLDPRPKAPGLRKGVGEGKGKGLKSLPEEKEVMVSGAGEGLSLTGEGTPHPLGLGGRR